MKTKTKDGCLHLQTNNADDVKEFCKLTEMLTIYDVGLRMNIDFNVEEEVEAELVFNIEQLKNNKFLFKILSKIK